MSKKFNSTHFVGDLGQGPAAYSPAKKNHNIRYSMAMRLKDLTIDQGPGPTNYSMINRQNLNHASSTLVGFAQALRSDPQGEEMKKMPGVGSYKLNFDPLH